MNKFTLDMTKGKRTPVVKILVSCFRKDGNVLIEIDVNYVSR